jgi:hypothetical protein
MKSGKKTLGIVRLTIFGQDFLLAANMTQGEIAEAWGKIKGISENSKKALAAFRDYELPPNNGYMFNHETLAVIAFETFHGSWNDYDILLHECVHAIRWLAKRSRFEDEEELNAYTTEHLFRLCRRVLDGTGTYNEIDMIIPAKKSWKCLIRKPTILKKP